MEEVNKNAGQREKKRKEEDKEGSSQQRKRKMRRGRGRREDNKEGKKESEKEEEVTSRSNTWRAEKDDGVTEMYCQTRERTKMEEKEHKDENDKERKT